MAVLDLLHTVSVCLSLLFLLRFCYFFRIVLNSLTERFPGFDFPQAVMSPPPPTPHMYCNKQAFVFSVSKRKQLVITLTKMYWLLGRKSKLSTSNKLLIYIKQYSNQSGLTEYNSGVRLPLPT
jgi:hypothetical protein